MSGIIKTKVENAFIKYRQTKDLKEFVFSLCRIADNSVNYQWQMDEVEEAINNEFEKLEDEVIIE